MRAAQQVAAVCVGLLVMGAALARAENPPSGSAVADLCRRAAQSPDDGQALADLGRAYGLCANEDLKGQLGVLYALGCRYQGLQRLSASLEPDLRRRLPMAPYLKYLSPVYAYALCTQCEGRGLVAERCAACGGAGCRLCEGKGIVRNRCVNCGGWGRLSSPEQAGCVYMVLLRRAAGAAASREPPQQISLSVVLAEVDRALASRQAPRDAKERAALAAEAGRKIEERLENCRIPLRMMVKDVVVEKAGVASLQVGPYSFLGDPLLEIGRLGLLCPEWIRVRGISGIPNRRLVGKEMILVGRPHWRSGTIEAGHAAGDAQLIAGLRIGGTDVILGSIVMRAFNAAIGDLRAVDTFRTVTAPGQAGRAR